MKIVSLSLNAFLWNWKRTLKMYVQSCFREQAPYMLTVTDIHELIKVIVETLLSSWIHNCKSGNKILGFGNVIWNLKNESRFKDMFPDSKLCFQVKVMFPRAWIFDPFKRLMNLCINWIELTIWILTEFLICVVPSDCDYAARILSCWIQPFIHDFWHNPD